MIIVKKIIRNLFYGNIAYQGFFKRLHRWSLLGMNYGTDPKITESGELRFIKTLAREARNQPWIILDVGAGVGEYAKFLLQEFGPNIKIYALEPSRTAFFRLAQINDNRARKYNVGLGQRGGGLLYSNVAGSGLGSLYKRRLEHRNLEMVTHEKVQLQSLDDFCKSNAINFIDFLKLDTEGHEFEILQRSFLFAQQKIKRIQFEFGGCNIDSRIFFQDFWYLLYKNYHIYRVLRNGLSLIKRYDERDEIFTATNYLAILKNLA